MTASDPTGGGTVGEHTIVHVLLIASAAAMAVATEAVFVTGANIVMDGVGPVR